MKNVIPNDEFREVQDFSDYIINQFGEVFIFLTGKEVKRMIVKGAPYVKLTNGETHRYRNVYDLVNETFPELQA